MGVSLCMIVRDDAATLATLLDRVRPHVDECILVDTGSVDETPSIARKYATKFTTYLGCNDPATELIADFADARNHALEMATQDFHLWLDGDDDIIGAESIQQMIARPEAAVMYLVPYEYTHDAQGRCTCLHWRENLVKPRSSLRWQIPVHEVLLPGIPMQVTEPAPTLRRIHRKHLSRRAPDPGRNLRILDKYVAAKGEDDVRALYYYGVELHHTPGRIGDAIRVLTRYVELSKWPDERCLAQLELARIYHREIGDQKTAIEWALQAMVEKSWPDPYWLISRAFFMLAAQGIETERNGRRSLHFAELGGKMLDAQTVLFVNPQERFEVHWHVNRLLASQNRTEAALESCRIGLTGMPDDPELTTRALIYQDNLTKNRVLLDVQRLKQMAEQLKPTGLFDEPQWVQFGQYVGQILGVQPPTPAPTFTAESEVPAQPKADGCLDVAFFLGPAYERWNPVTLATGGMGGSETMAWELARRLRGLGHRVRVFADCGPTEEGIFDGVEWLNFARFPNIKCDVLIASRRPDVVDPGVNVSARVRILWVHDVHAGEGLTQSRALRFDRILALSHWHKHYLLQTYSRANGAPYPIASLHPDDVHVTRNGIDLGRFDADAPRNPKRVVYSSSPDRGLSTLLEMWPSILAAEPEAELHCYYGLAGWEASSVHPEYAGHRYMSAEALRRLKHQLRNIPRVTMRGRINQTELAREFMQSGAWIYPTWFTETSCITAQEAQAAGLYIVTTPVAALNETVGNRGVRVPGGWDTNDGPNEAARQEFIGAVIRALREEGQPMTREALQTFARENFSLDALAADWDRELRSLVDRMDTDVVPRFRG